MNMKKDNVSLTGRQVRHLRALGHHLKAVVLVGKEGITPALVSTVDECLANHELLKIKLLENCPEDRRAAAYEIAKQTRSHVAQVVGRTILLYRKAENPEIILP